VYLVSASGSILNSGTTQIAPTTLAAGTYYVIASSNISGATGPYTLSINVLPYLSGVIPPFGALGASVSVTLSGDRFASPMTVNAGSGITVSDVNVVNPTSATATFGVSAVALVGSNTVSVTAAAGTSNPRAFSIFPAIPTISPGQSIPGTLETTDGRNPFGGSVPADLYLLTLDGSTPITLDFSTGAFPPVLYLLSASGSILSQGATQIVTTLSAGTYYVVASSNTGSAAGPYMISLNSGGVRRTRSQITSQ
jgi:hypothetical protein